MLNCDKYQTFVTLYLLYPDGNLNNWRRGVNRQEKGEWNKLVGIKVPGRQINKKMVQDTQFFNVIKQFKSGAVAYD